MTLAEVAREPDVPPDTLRRWAREGLVPLPGDRWTPEAKLKGFSESTALFLANLVGR